MQLVDDYAQIHTHPNSQVREIKAARQRVADYIESIGAGGVSGALFGAADMATAAAQGFRDGQAALTPQFPEGKAGEVPVWDGSKIVSQAPAEHPDTKRLRFVAETIDEPWDDTTIAAQERELPDGVKTLDDLRKLVDLRMATRGAV
jgi:hypothetical protein